MNQKSAAVPPQTQLDQLIELNGWLDLPQTITTRESYELNVSSDRWLLRTSQGVHSVDVGLAQHPIVRWAVKRYLIHRIQFTSSIEGQNSGTSLNYSVLPALERCGLGPNTPVEGLKDKLIEAMQQCIFSAREEHRLHNMYRPVRWYVWCADNFPDLGFCVQYANEIDGLSIPSNPKGEAVRLEDPEEGPLDRIYEMPLLRQTLELDDSNVWEHLQQKAALALAIAFGRNPSNLVWLNEEDLSAEFETIPGLDPFYTLKIPRIKKRQRYPRDRFKVEPLDRPLARHVQELIEANQSMSATVETSGGTFDVNRPLFFRRPRDLNDGRVSIDRVFSPDLADSILRMDNRGITRLLKDFVTRHNLISPVTGERMRLNSRRLRYTLATGLVEEGISRRELAEILDHSDTQSVEVYFELRGQIVKHLDAAALQKLAKLVGFFKGTVVSRSGNAKNEEIPEKHLHWVDESNPEDGLEIGVCGESTICHLDPPFSCYLCPKFQPYREADHQHVLDQLLISRSDRLEKYEGARLGLQLDDVIAAVSSAVAACKDKG